MKYSFSLMALALCATEVVAFPSELLKMASPEQRRAINAAVASSTQTSPNPGVKPSFSASAQYVSNKGQYAFVAPTSTDQRGPCPGLNAAANHGYIPHNGVATIQQFIDGTYAAFGMGKDLGGFLAIYGAVFDGDLKSWSIGGSTPAPLTTLTGGLVGGPHGLIGSHNNYEADASPTRPDLYQYGNNYLVEMSQWQQMYDLPLGPYGYDLSALTPFRATRFQQSINNNPYFFNGPFSGVLVQPAAYTFIYRYMANKSAEFPEGYLDANTLKSFFSITGTPGNFKYTPGYEKIPDNWYKRAIGDEYGLVAYIGDVMAAAEKYPQFLSIGGNTGKVNTFTGVDVTNLTGGVYNAQTLAQGNNAACFALQFAQQAAPDVLKGLLSTLSNALSVLNNELGGVLSGLQCPQLKSIDTSQLAQYPGASGSY